MEMRELVIENRDGKRMPSTLRLPEGAPKGTVLLFHGLGGLRDQTLLRVCASEFAQAGYATLAVDDSHGVRSLDARIFESSPTQYVEDACDAIAYAKEQAWYAAPLALIGHSMGGFAAARYARLSGDDDARLALLAPAISWNALWGAELLFILVWLATGRQKMLTIDEQHFRLGRSWILDFMRYSLLKDAPRIRARTLIIEAGRDEVVDARAVARFARRLPCATAATIPHADHDFDGHEAEVVATIRQWLTSS